MNENGLKWLRIQQYASIQVSRAVRCGSLWDKVLYKINVIWLLLQLPKIEAQIRELVSEYEAKTGNTFTVDGKPLLQLMEDEWETRKAVSKQNRYLNF